VGILSKIREKRMQDSTDEKQIELKRSRKKRKSKRKLKTDKVGVSVDASDKEKEEVLPDIDDVGKWLDKIRSMAKDGLKELDKYYDNIVGDEKDTGFILNLAIVMSNYLSFRYEAYSKLAEYYGNVSKAIKEVDKVMSDIDSEFMDKAIGVIRRWMKENTQ